MVQNRRATGLLFLIIGFALAYIAGIWLIFAPVFWIIGTMLFAKSYLD